MTRDETPRCYQWPVGVGAEISPVLLTRLVNDVGDNPDQLRVLQHALNRTLARWRSEGEATRFWTSHSMKPLHYGPRADQHAEKAYAELTTSDSVRLREAV